MNSAMNRRSVLTMGAVMAGSVGAASAQPLPNLPMEPTHFRDVKTHYGAIGNGLADDSSALEAALGAGRPVFVPPGCYRTTRSLRATNNSHLFGSGRTFSPRPERDAWIVYDGPVSVNAAVIRASAGTVGDMNSPALSNIVLEDLVLDGNGKAGFGLYICAARNESRFERLTAINAVVDGIWANQLYYCVLRDLVARHCGGNGMTLGVNTFQSADGPEFNGVLVENVRAHENGSAAGSNPGLGVFARAGYGVQWGAKVGCTLTNVVSERSYNAGLCVCVRDGPNTVTGGYLENNFLQPANDNQKIALAVTPHAAGIRGLKIEGLFISNNTPQGVYFRGNGAWRPASPVWFSRIFYPAFMNAEWPDYIWEQSRSVEYLAERPLGECGC